MRNVKLAIPAFLLVLLMANTGCVKFGENDIRGIWSFTSGSEKYAVYYFSGALEAGRLEEPDFPMVEGSYSVSGKEVIFEWASTWTGGGRGVFHGSFVSDDRIAGTMDVVAPYPPFEWTYELEGRRQ